MAWRRGARPRGGAERCECAVVELKNPTSSTGFVGVISAMRPGGYSVSVDARDKGGNLPRWPLKGSLPEPMSPAVGLATYGSPPKQPALTANEMFGKTGRGMHITAAMWSNAWYMNGPTNKIMMDTITCIPSVATSSPALQRSLPPPD